MTAPSSVGHAITAHKLQRFPGSPKCSPAIRLSVASQSSGPTSNSSKMINASATDRARLFSSFCSLITPSELSTTRRVRCATIRSRSASLPASALTNSPASLPELEPFPRALSACETALNPTPNSRNLNDTPVPERARALPVHPKTRTNFRLRRAPHRICPVISASWRLVRDTAAILP